MLKDYKNGCHLDTTMFMYEWMKSIPHIHSYSMYVDDDGLEVVTASFDLHRINFMRV